MNSDSEFGGGPQNNSIYSYGMHFCPTCQNLMRPSTFTSQLLDFTCDKCNRKVPVDYSRRTGEDSLLYCKELQAGSRKFVQDLAYIFDPTMPSVEIQCTECGFNKAVYMLTPDEGETKMVARMICANATGTVAKCGHTWILDEESELTKTKVISEEEKFFENL